jgi:hypothetical protein
MEYKPSNSGLLAVSMVKEGDKLLIIEDAYSVFNAEKQKTYWNAKVELPDGSHKLAGLMETVCDQFAAVWGNDTAKWTGRTAIVSIKTSKAGNPYIWLTPAAIAAVDISQRNIDNAAKVSAEHLADELPAIEYPENDIDPNSIPF